MSLEWLIAIVLLAVALFPLRRGLPSVAGWMMVILFFGLAVGALGWRQTGLRAREKSRAEVAEKIPEQGQLAGYATSDNCRACHPGQHQSWHQSFHRTMTQLPSAETVRGDFKNVTLNYDGRTYHLEQQGDEFWVDMEDPDWTYVQTLKRAVNRPDISTGTPPRARKRISMLTGSHSMQAYWVPGDYGNMQFGFPFTYVFAEKRWLPRNDVFLLDPVIPWTMQVWNVNCLNCHATAGQPRQDSKTKIINSRVAELGISCEACHGPAEEHIRANSNPQRRYALHAAKKGDSTIYNPARQNHVKSSETCGQCHAIRHNNKKELWNAEGLHFWPGEEIESKAPLVKYDGKDLDVPGNEKKRALMEGSYWNDGQVRVSGRDFSGMALSGCYTRGDISCLSCHSMHQYQSNDDQLARDKEGNQACLQCHTSYADKLEQHTHHRAGSVGSLCYNCHMPHTSYGLLKAIRSHTINSPTVQSSLDTGRPNACNLCHLDKPLGWTAQHLNEWFRQPVPALTEEQKTTSAGVTWLLKGDAGQRALIAWHMGWEPAQTTSGHAWIPRFLAETLVDPYSTVRYISGRSLKTLPGYTEFPYDYIAPAPQRTEARLRALNLWRGQPASAERNVILKQSAPMLQEDKVDALLRQRDNRLMELLE